MLLTNRKKDEGLDSNSNSIARSKALGVRQRNVGGLRLEVEGKKSNRLMFEAKDRNLSNGPNKLK